MTNEKQIHILLTDDDDDDRFFFEKALTNISIPTSLSCLEDGEALLDQLTNGKENLPDLLFLDINMPRKNGLECLKEIKANKKINYFPVIIYSTSLNEPVADAFYKNGAHYYVKKCDFKELVQSLEAILSNFQNNNFERPAREKFVFNLQQA